MQEWDERIFRRNVRISRRRQARFLDRALGDVRFLSKLRDAEIRVFGQRLLGAFEGGYFVQIGRFDPNVACYL